MVGEERPRGRDLFRRGRGNRGGGNVNKKQRSHSLKPPEFATNVLQYNRIFGCADPSGDGAFTRQPRRADSPLGLALVNKTITAAVPLFTPKFQLCVHR